MEIDKTSPNLIAQQRIRNVPDICGHPARFAYNLEVVMPADLNRRSTGRSDEPIQPIEKFNGIFS